MSSLVKFRFDEESQRRDWTITSPRLLLTHALVTSLFIIGCISFLYITSRYNTARERHTQRLTQEAIDREQQQADCKTLGRHWAHQCALSADWVPGDIAGNAHRLALEDTFCIYGWAHLIVDCELADREYNEHHYAVRSIPQWVFMLQFLSACISSPVAAVVLVSLGLYASCGTTLISGIAKAREGGGAVGHH